MMMVKQRVSGILKDKPQRVLLIRQPMAQLSLIHISEPTRQP